MAALFVVLAVVPAALVLRLIHSAARGLFPTVPPWVTIGGTITVAGMAPVMYFLIGEYTRQLLTTVGVNTPRHEAFILAVALMVVVALVVALIVVPRRRRHEADAWKRLSRWHIDTAARSDLFVGRVQHLRCRARRAAGWAAVSFAGTVHNVWLDGGAQVGEFVLLHCHPYRPVAQIVDRLGPRESAEATRHAQHAPPMI